MSRLRSPDEPSRGLDVRRHHAGASPALGVIAMAFLLATSVSPVRAQAGVRLHGVVVGAGDGAPIGRVTLHAGPGAAAPSTTTTAAGTFVLVVGGLPVQLVASRIGFAPETLRVVRAGEVLELRLSPAPVTLDATVVRAERGFTAASSSAIRELDLRLRPHESSQDLLRLAPGLIVAQHAGGGKAEQIFMRGFDADHGTDVALTVDGIPVNMVTHAHGQGYADVHWLMPEVVERVEVRKGPFDVRDGDFATAGAVAFATRDRVERPSVAVRAGGFGTRHLVALVPVGGDATRPGGYVAASRHRSDGPFQAPQGYGRTNAYAKWSAPVGGLDLVASASGFESSWRASGQVPDRAVRAGRISRFGSIDSTEGGATSRHDLMVGVRSRQGGPAQWDATAFATRYRFRLYSNFTFFLVDSQNGDGIEQRDARTMAGGSASYRRERPLLGHAGSWATGLGVRTDAGEVQLHRQRARTRLGSLVLADARQAHLYQWARYELELAPRLRMDAGARGDLFRFAVTDRLGDGSGTRWEGIVNPRVNLAYDATTFLRLFANAGTGFHSNDGRDAILAGSAARVLPRARSAELGSRTTWSGGTLALSSWWLDLESETVYVGDEGTTEARGRTRRLGVDLESRLQLRTWLWAELDANVAHARFRDAPRAADRVPLAPTMTAVGGLVVRPDDRTDGGARLRHVGARAATEDASVTARGYSVLELFASRQVGRARLFASVDNATDVRWNEAQFATTSRLRGETGAVTELHYTPGAPRSAQVGVEYRF